MSIENVFLKAALSMLDRGWLAMPLMNDPAGYPKRPIVQGWSKLERSKEVVESLPWDDAKGLGIVLGATSSNLAVIDIDDQALATAVFSIFGATEPPPRLVRTARNRGHFYLYELDGASPSTRFTVTWDERPVTIEFKANGTQVAAPPSPGYTLITKYPPLDACISIATAWDWVIFKVEKAWPGYLKVPEPTEEGGAGYPTAWQEEVPKEARNNTLYIEAHRLREAGTPLRMAMGMLLNRINESYAKGDFSEDEAIKTIESAYRKGTPTPLDRGNDEHLIQ